MCLRQTSFTVHCLISYPRLAVANMLSTTARSAVCFAPKTQARVARRALTVRGETKRWWSTAPAASLCGGVVCCGSVLYGCHMNTLCPALAASTEAINPSIRKEEAKVRGPHVAQGTTAAAAAAQRCRRCVG